MVKFHKISRYIKKCDFLLIENNFGKIIIIHYKYGVVKVDQVIEIIFPDVSKYENIYIK